MNEEDLKKGSTLRHDGSSLRQGSSLRHGSSLRQGSTLRARALAIAGELAQLSARDIAYVLFRRKGIVISFFVLVVLGACAYLFVTPYTFESSAKLLIRQGRENLALDTAIVDGGGRVVSQNNENAINSEIAILRSLILAEHVVEALGQTVVPENDTEEGIFAAQLKSLVRYGMGLPKQLLASLKPDKQTPMSAHGIAVRKINNGLDVEVEKRTNILALSFTANSPERAQQTLEKYVELFLARHIEIHAPQASTQFFEGRAKELEEALLDKQNKRDADLMEHGIATVDSQKSAILEQINNAEVNRSTAAAEIAGSQAKVKAFELALTNRPEKVVSSETDGLVNAMAEKLKSTLADLRLQESDMAARYAETYRPLVELQQQIKQVEEMLANEEKSSKTITTALDPGYQQIKLELDMERASLESQKAREEILAADVDKWRQELKTLTGHEGELALLNRELELAEKEYMSYQEGLQQAKTSAALDMDKVSNISVVQPATYSQVPVAPRSMRTLALALFLGLFGSVFLAFALDYIDDKVYTKEDLEEHLAVPVLTVITDKEFYSKRATNVVYDLPERQQEAEAQSKELVPVNSQLPEVVGPIEDKMFSLNRRLSVLMEHNPNTMLLFAGMQPPRDSSELVREYAQLMARHGWRVLLLALGPVNFPLVSQDLPTTQQWKEAMNNGFALDKIIRQVGSSNLFFAQIGHVKEPWESITALPKFDQLMSTMRGDFDMMFVDCPPLAESSLATRLSILGDGVILVVDSGKTRWQVMRNHVKEIQENRGTVLGVILNKRKFYVPDSIYRWL